MNGPSLVSESEKLRDHIHKLFCDENYLSFRYWSQVVEAWDIDIDLSLSPLHYASYFELPDSVRRLLNPSSNAGEAMGVVSTIRNELQGQMTPLQIAGIRGNLEIVSLFLDSGMRIAQSDFEYIIGNNERNGLAVMTSILKARPDLSITDDTVEAAAGNVSTTEFVKYFLNNGFLLSKVRLLRVLCHWQDDRDIASPGLRKALKKHGENLGCTGQDFFNDTVQGYVACHRWNTGIHGYNAIPWL